MVPVLVLSRGCYHHDDDDVDEEKEEPETAKKENYNNNDNITTSRPRGNDVKSSSQEFNYTEERRGTEAAGRTDGLGEAGERRWWRGGEGRVQECCNEREGVRRGCHLTHPSVLTPAGLCSEDEERLVRDLFRGYNKLIRPVENMTNNVDVAFGLAFIQLINVVSVSLSSLLRRHHTSADPQAVLSVRPHSAAAHTTT
ncbi:Acetylcholine receptor subunit beta-like 1 [Portunus trituberculatus]|uniref:Acetylcholine receptor subunit beta-like 1 n=1 Tax=Portunus trituberculatus TaxID=210409 RepID=A0A5B7D178_PORTR|nr:Acetylcholine receptor subunit beta-like 1 [Portunus trituberculatus]